jgi:hypothetical protein
LRRQLSKDEAMPTSPSWTTFVDPFEHAFTIAIPAGWRVTGGLLRHSPIDPNICMRLVSPDMRTLIILGDPRMGMYLTPQPAFFGWPSPPPGRIPQRPYLSGVDYARAYVLETLAETLEAVALISQKPRPDLAQGRHTQFNPMARHDGGEATFTCQRGGEAAVGLIGADTYIYGWPTQGGVLWGVGLLAGFVAPPQGVAAATEILVQSARSAQIDTTWLARQKQLSDAYALGILELGAAMRAAAQESVGRTTRIIDGIARAQRESFAKTQVEYDAQQQEMDEIVSGYSDYLDSSGNVYKLDNTKEYHYADGLGRTSSTNNRSAPGLNWELLKRRSP